MGFMNKFFKILVYIAGGLVFIIVGFIVYFNSSYPKVDPPSNEKVEITPARLERGKYLAHHVAVCMDCHSTRDWSKFTGPLKSGTLGMGGDEFNEQNAGVPGKIYPKNITPAAIGSWTDGELIRAITNGVSKDGTALFPIMPYMGYNKLTKEDLFSIVAYVRSIKPIEKEIPERSLNFPLNFIVKTIPPKSYSPSPEPDRNNPVEYGNYLVTVAGCFDCHTEQEKGEFKMEKAFAGGFEFKFPGGIVRSANITPDKTTGIGGWTKEQFILRFKIMDPDSNQIPTVGMNDFNTAMPWTMYAGMTREDLGAMYEYLKTIKPVVNNVVKYSPKN